MSVKALTWAFEQHGISDGAKILLLVLADYADEDGVCWPSRRTLAERVHKSADTVDRRIEQLVETGLISVEGRNRATASGALVPMANVYRLHLEKAARRSRRNAARHTPTDANAGSRKNAATETPEEGGGRKSADSRNSAAGVAAKDAATVAAFPRSHIDKPPLEPSDSFDALRATDAALVAEAMRLAGDVVNVAQGAVHHAADLRALIAPSKGLPCDWALDVAPAIVAKAAKARARGETIGSWSWIREGAVRLRDRRLQGLPDPVIPFASPDTETADARRQPGHATAARERQARDSDAGMLAAAGARSRAARAVSEPEADCAAPRRLAAPAGGDKAG